MFKQKNCDLSFANTSANIKDTTNTSVYSSKNQTTNNFYQEYKLVLDYPLEKPINRVIFCPFEQAQNILAFSSFEKIFIYLINFIKNESEQDSKFESQLIKHYTCGSICTSISFSPKTNFSYPSQGYLSFASATGDFGILVTSDIVNDTENASQIDQPTSPDVNKFFYGHTDYVNDMAFEPISNQYLASTSDDCTCIVWSLSENDPQESVDEDNNQYMKILLSSPGITVKWHKSEPKKLLVAEKKGLIRFYNTDSRCAVMSFDCCRYPLMSSDWCIENSLYIGCTSGRDLFIWDTSLTSLPIKVLKTNAEGLSDFKFYDSRLIAFRGWSSNSLSVVDFTNNQIYLEKEFCAGRGASWNSKIPILAVGGPQTIHFLKFRIF